MVISNQYAKDGAPLRPDESDLAASRAPDRLEDYLLRQSAALLDKTGNTEYIKRLAGLGIDH